MWGWAERGNGWAKNLDHLNRDDWVWVESKPWKELVIGECETVPLSLLYTVSGYWRAADAEENTELREWEMESLPEVSPEGRGRERIDGSKQAGKGENVTNLTGRDKNA